MRLTKTIKEQIATAAVAKSGLLKKEALAKEALEEIAEEVRVFALGGPENVKTISFLLERYEKETANLPTGVLASPFHRTHSIYVYFSNGGGLRLYFGKVVPTTSSVQVEKDSSLGARVLAYKESLDSVQGEKQKLHNEVMAALSPFNTKKQVLSHWPEAEALFPPEEAKQNLVVVQVSGLNKAIGLP